MRRLVLLAVLSVLLVVPSTASAAGSISSLSVSPSMVRDGAPALGTVTLAFPDFSPTTVLLFGGRPGTASVPPPIVVPAGATSADFTITTNAAAPPEIVQVMAAVDNVPRTATLRVTPGAPPAADRVAIKKARWKAGRLTIEATSTNPNAILSVFGRTDFFMFTLTNDGGGRFSDQRGFITNPERITVRSNFGGSASANLTNYVG